MKQEIFGPNGQLRAVIYDYGSTREIYTPEGTLLGKYTKATNETHSASGSFIGRGDLLLTLI
jgi:hypothetical protein